MDKVAVYIDADNISATHAGEIMKRAVSLGDVVICRAYGNCSAFTGEKSWKEGVRLFGIQAFPQISICENKKNNADFALMLDAWETVLTDCVSAICIVSSDSDFLPLVQRIRPRMSVYGFGGEQTPMAYQLAFMKFFVLGECKSLEKSEKNEESPKIPNTQQGNQKAQAQPVQMSSATQQPVSQLTPRQALLVAYEIARVNNACSNNCCTRTAWGEKLMHLNGFLSKEYQSKNKLLSKLLKLEDNQTLFVEKKNGAEDMVSLSPLGISCFEKERAHMNAVINKLTAVMQDEGK